MNGNKKIILSPSALEALSRCPRCFWLKYNKKIYQPEGIVSRLASRFDIILKKYDDIYRKIGEMPPILKDKIRGRLENPLQSRYVFSHNEKYSFEGRLDDCLIMEDGEYAPIDFKTSSSDPREKTEILPAYQTQMDSYAFLLDESGKKTSGLSYLIFIYPEESFELHNGFPMAVHIITLKTNPGAAKEKFLKAIEVLEGEMPESSADCSFCQWYRKVGEELNRI